MQFLVKVRVDVKKMAEFGEKLRAGGLDRSAITSETFCLSDDPAVGYSVWQALDEADFEKRFSSWRPYYAETQVRCVIPPGEAMKRLL